MRPRQGLTREHIFPWINNMDLTTGNTVCNVVLAIDPGCHNLGLAVTSGGTLVEWRVADLVPSVKQPPISRIVQGAVTLVGGLSCIPNVVLIEQQPNLNVGMKVLSHVLQALCTVVFPGATVTLVSPKAYKVTGGTYATRKRDSVARVTELVADDAEWGAVFRAHRKKDDLADALLLARWQV